MTSKAQIYYEQLKMKNLRKAKKQDRPYKQRSRRSSKLSSKGFKGIRSIYNLIAPKQSQDKMEVDEPASQHKEPLVPSEPSESISKSPVVMPSKN